MIPLRLVLDTNIVVSAALNPDGLERTVVILAITKPAALYVSQPIIAEYRDELRRPKFNLPKGARRQLLQLILNHARVLTPSARPQVTTDPDDNMFLECADAARADYLVTGNTRHFPELWIGTKIITSSQFLALITPHILP